MCRQGGRRHRAHVQARCVCFFGGGGKTHPSPPPNAHGLFYNGGCLGATGAPCGMRLEVNENLRMCYVLCSCTLQVGSCELLG